MSYLNKMIFSLCQALCLMVLSVAIHAQPFANCPTEGFLIQDSVARLYGVNLATGYYEELSNNLGTGGKINAIGFNLHDNYLYGFDYSANTIVKIGSDYNAVPLSVSGLPDISFYVGDVSTEHNSYYAYRKGSSFGLYKIDLDESSPDYLIADKIVNGNDLSAQIYDFAFHPNNGYLYSVDARGNLLRIDPDSGLLVVLANVGETGTFGAVYFDVNGNFYISRNTDGNIFRIDVGSSSPWAEFFAFGPSSSNNDGARCAVAPIISADSNVDFGDAPDSYGTSIANNGARHEVTGDLSLGDIVGNNDGATFVTGFETGLDTLIKVDGKGQGYVNIWVDWDQSGTFDTVEQSLVDYLAQEENNKILMAIPSDAKSGNTWLRIRYSSSTGIDAVGGVSDGEVEDYQITVTESGVSIISYPSSNTYVTLAYEDNWPELGDYDMNDVVMAYRTREYFDENNRRVRYDIEGRTLAIGASYHNGFAVQLDNIATSNIAKELIRFKINGVEQASSPLEENSSQADAVIILTDDLWSYISSTEKCPYYRTKSGCEQQQTFTFSVSVPLIASVSGDDAPSAILNPFIFATPGHYHGDAFDQPPGRALEIHLKNKSVSERFDRNLFNLYDDNSNGEDTSFLSTKNMPWALELPMLWSHPLEYVDISHAYPDFPVFVESQGLEKSKWYLNDRASTNKIMLNN